MGTTEHPSKRSEGFEVNLLRQGTPETFMMDGRVAQGQIIGVNAQNQRQMQKVVNGWETPDRLNLSGSSPGAKTKMQRTMDLHTRLCKDARKDP